MSVSMLPPRLDQDARAAKASNQPEPEQLRDESDADFSAPGIVALLLLSLIPFWLVPVAHLCSSTETATGFFHYELPYYVANGRSAFERGNGILYPNPYDPSADSPSIYAHWIPWTLGLLTSKLGCDAGDVIMAFTFFASLIFSWATRQLVALTTSSGSQQSVVFLLAMWGGGLLACFGTIAGVVNSANWLESALQYDPGNGLWFLNWGRNALFPTESVYHALVAFCWLSEIRRRHGMANVWMLLLATTHPWSGLELLLTINLWRSFQAVRSLRRNNSQRNETDVASDNGVIPTFRAAITQLSISTIALIVFLGYYKMWLPSFPQHAELQNTWELNWSVSWTTALLAYSMVLIPAMMSVRRMIASWSFRESELFLLCALFIATGLAFHDRLIKPVQPIHFTRGYVWMPLFLLGLPVILQWWSSLRRASPKFAIAGVMIVVVFVADNFIFSFVHASRQLQQLDGFHLDSDDRGLCLFLHESPTVENCIVLTDSETLNYLLPTYTDVRPWLGHHFNTPSFPERRKTWRECFEGNSIAVEQIPEDVEVLIVRRNRDCSILAEIPGWSPLKVPNAEWTGWKRN